MQYARIITPFRTGRIALEPTNFGAPYQKLFDQTDVSGYEEWLLESYDNFRNPFAQASQRRHDEMGYWAVIHRDRIPRQEARTDDKSRLHITYISHDGTEWEKKHDVWAPKSGWYVPTQAGVFHEGTLVPFETAGSKDEAIKVWEKAGLDTDYTSYFYRLDNYKDGDRFIGRGFIPLLDGNGRFGIHAGGLPSRSDDDWVASRPKCEESVTVMEVALPKKEQ